MATEQKDFRVKNGLQVGNGATFGGPVVVGTPSLNTHATTKLYVDEAIAAGGGGGSASGDGGTVTVPDFTMQQRRGTAYDWGTEDPVLAEGEIGFETDTGLFKIGDGTTQYSLLNYFIDSDSLSGSLEDYILLSTKGQALGVAELDADGDVPASQLGNAEPAGAVSSHNLTTLNVHGIADTSLLATTSDLTNKQDKVSGVSDTEIGYLSNVTSDIQQQINDKQDKVAGVSDSEIGYLSNVTSDIQSQIDAKASLSGPIFTGAVTLHADPTQALHAATKQYVDNISAGLHVHEACHVATTDTLANLCSSTVTYDNGSSGVGATLTLGAPITVIDGHTLTNGDRVLVKNETMAAHNGIYIRTSSTVLTRASDFDSAAEIAGGDFIFIENGTLYNSTGWVSENEVNVVGTDPVSWIQFAGAGTYTAGVGLELSGTQFSIDEAVVAQLNNTTFTGTTNIANLNVSTSTTIANGLSVTSGTATFGDITASNIDLNASGTADFTAGTTTVATPTLNAHAATKEYVDTQIAANSGPSVVTTTVTSNDSVTIDTLAVSSFTTVQYILSIKQGTKTRSSIILGQNNGSEVDYTQYAIIETGGAISGFGSGFSLSGSNAVLTVLIPGSSTTNSTVSFIRSLL